LNDKLCFSVVGANETLDFEAQSKAIAELWVKGLRKIIGHSVEKSDALAKQGLVDNGIEIEEKKSSFFSFSNSIAYVAPYISAFVVCECFMMICAQFIGKGSAFGTVTSQCIAMCVLLCFTFKWSMRDLNKYGLTQNEPVFPFGISVLKNFAFFCGLIGCLLHVLRRYYVIDVVLELFLLFVGIAIFALVFGLIFVQNHAFFNPLDDDLNRHLLILFDKGNKSLTINDETPEDEQDLNEKLLLKKEEVEQEANEEIIIPFVD